MTALSEDGSIGVYDLKTHLSSVLEEVIAGREVTVTRHGHAIARIAPVVQTTRAERLRVIEEMRAARAGRRFPPGESAAELVREGRDERFSWI